MNKNKVLLSKLAIEGGNPVRKHFLPYGHQWLDEDDIQAVVEVLNSDFLTQGPKVKEFEDRLCKITDSKYCVAVSNGTAALHLAVACLQIEKGKEGITSPNTFMASANCIVHNGLRPIFADITEDTYCIDPKKIEEKVSGNTSLLIPVHFAGQPCEMQEINKIAKNNKLFIIEDAAHAIGSKYADGSNVGNCKFSDLTTFSFHPVKTITTGEGGAITTNSKKLLERLKSLRNHGIVKDKEGFEYIEYTDCPWYHEMQYLGFNYRLTDIHAAIGISQLKKLDRFANRRREIVGKYNIAFKDVEWLKIPYEREKVYSVFHLYILQFYFNKLGKSRKQVMEELRNKNIGTQVHYIPVHLQPYYKENYGYKEGDYPKAEAYYEKCLSIPLYPKMKNKDVEYVIENVMKLV